MLNILKASAADASFLTKISREIYQEHYLHLWHPGGASWYMETYAYANDNIKNDLEDPLIEYYIVAEGGNYLGYLKLVINASLSTEPLLEALEVERIYLYKYATGKGHGKKIMEFAKQRAMELSKKIIFLKAMDSSLNAIAFYEKMGYQVCSALQLPLPTFILMKKEYRGMLILQQHLNK